MCSLFEAGEFGQALGHFEFGAVAFLGGRHEGAARSGRRSGRRSRCLRATAGGRPRPRSRTSACSRRTRRRTRPPRCRSCRPPRRSRSRCSRRRCPAVITPSRMLRHFVGLALGQHPFAGVVVGFVDLAVGEFDPADRGRVVVDAAVGEGRVGVGHFQRRDADRGDRRSPRPAPIRSGDSIPISCAVWVTFSGPTSRSSWAKTTLTESQVASASDIVPPPGSALLTVQVPPPGSVERHRRGAVVVGRVGVDALLDRRRQDEGLERGARLAVRLPGVVELVFAGVAFGRGEGDDLAGVRVDRGEAGRRAAFRVADGSTVDRFFGLCLQARVDRRVGLEAAVADGVDPVVVDQFLLDQVEEEGVADHLVLVAGVEAEAAVRALRGIRRR